MSELSDSNKKELFKKFVKKWNAKKLPEVSHIIAYRLLEYLK